MSNRQFHCEWARGQGLEALALGLAYGAWLCCASVCLVGSFQPAGLSAPYWKEVPGLRTDTCGIAALLAGAICFTTSEYLRLRRRRDGVLGRRRPSGATALMVRAMSETVAIVATGLVIYVSVNSVTHPATLSIQATHLAARPTEGTVRAVALLLCACSITILRYLQTGPTSGRGTRTAVSSLVAGDSRDHARRKKPDGDTRDANGSGPHDAVPGARVRESESVPANGPRVVHLLRSLSSPFLPSPARPGRVAPSEWRGS